MTENKYVKMMLDMVDCCRRVAISHDEDGDDHLRDHNLAEAADWEAADWKAAAEAFEALVEACQTGATAIELHAKLLPEVKSEGLAETRQYLLAAIKKAGVE